MKDKITSNKFSVALLVTAIISGVGGALLLGEILHTVARIAFHISDESYTVIIIPAIILVVLGVLGTLVLILAVFIENKVLKVLTILFSIAIPILIEVIDLSIRTFVLIDELMRTYPELSTLSK
jgi:hypothetical protein